MKISWIKAKNDKHSFMFQQNMGWNVVEIEDLDETDKTINELVKNNYNTIILFYPMMLLVFQKIL